MTEMPERVTTGAELTSSQEATPRVGQKDPKKVAAGRAGAAARKAKHEKLLAELREVKNNMREPASIAHNSGGSVDSTMESADGVASTITDWTPWVVGGIGLAAFAWFLRERSSSVAKPKPAFVAAAKPLAAKSVISAGPAKQLKPSPDPFYME